MENIRINPQFSGLTNCEVKTRIARDGYVNIESVYRQSAQGEKTFQSPAEFVLKLPEKENFAQKFINFETQ